MSGLFIFAVILVLWAITGYYSLRDLVRRADGDPTYEPSIKEVIVYMILSLIVVRSTKKRK